MSGSSELARGYSDGDIDTNRTSSRHLMELVEERYSRRQALMRSVAATTTAFLGTGLLAACDGLDLLSDSNTTPFNVTAGGTSATTAGRVVTLQGTQAAGTATASNWVQVGGPAVQLTGANTATASFIAPAVAGATPLEFRYETTGAGAGQAASANTIVTVSPAELGFTAVAKNRTDLVTVPAGYSVTVMTRLGDPIFAGVPTYANNGTDSNFAQRIGDHGDALYWYGLTAAGARDDNSSTRGLMVQNHENLNVQYLHPSGPTNVASGPRPAGEALKEIEAHGVSVTEYRDTTGNRQWSYVQDSPFNRRITPSTPVQFNGPVRGPTFLATPFSPSGTTGRGTINNCANGHTLWGTNITCEENWSGYFRRSGDDALRTVRELTALRRYGVTGAVGNFAWSTVAAPAGTEDISTYRRWDARATVGGSPTTDWRNEPNQFGWCVEFDPYNPNSVPRKRTALGRMGHEGAWFGSFIPGRRLAVYLGDDARDEYFYKFVSSATWTASDAQATDRLAVGDKYLDTGTLYVARFNADGTGIWVPLVFGQVPNRAAVGADPAYVFADQADILVNARLAADAVSATPMDRPEWTATNNATGEIYLTLTNNRVNERPLDQTDAANPRYYTDPKITVTPPDANPQAPAGNPNGHILRLRENGDDPAATGFRWDIYLFGADAADANAANVNLSGLTADNDFSSPDGLWFSRPQNPSGLIKPLLWIQTDDNAFTDRTNNQMLAALPGTTGDGAQRTITNTGSGATAGQTRQQTTFVGAPATAASLRRFLVGPVECEITGVDTTPDGRTLFVGIQHPGESGSVTAPSSSWPASQGSGPGPRPRSAIVAITKNDGGVVGL